MSRLLTHDEFQTTLHNFYIEHYGEHETDHWYPDPAVNVRVFSRDTKLITLKAHLLTGVVTEHIEEISK